jgi:hypothetical protein
MFTPLFFTQLVRALTALFAVCYLLFLVRSFGRTRRFRLRLCCIFWVTLFLQYLVSFIATRLAQRETHWFGLIVVMLDVCQLTSLVFIAETLPIASRFSQVLKLSPSIVARSVAVALGVGIIVAAALDPHSFSRDLLQSAFGFLALAWFSLRWSFAVPPRLLYLAFPMLLYGLTYLLVFGPEPANDSPMRAALSVLNVLLFVCLAFACYYTLSDPKPRTAPLIVRKVRRGKPTTRKLDNLWEFLFAALTEGSGRAAVFALIALAIAMAASNLSKLFGHD